MALCVSFLGLVSCMSGQTGLAENMNPLMLGRDKLNGKLNLLPLGDEVHKEFEERMGLPEQELNNQLKPWVGSRMSLRIAKRDGQLTRIQKREAKFQNFIVRYFLFSLIYNIYFKFSQGDEEC